MSANTTANTDSISKALNLSPMITLGTDPMIKPITNSLSDSARSDFEIARANLHEIINTGLESLEKLSQIADASQHPRAFEVIAKLIETVAAANKDLLELQASIRNLDDNAATASGGNVTNNLFVGSTAELQKVINNLKK
jgi:hypothetical protein